MCVEVIDDVQRGGKQEGFSVATHSVPISSTHDRQYCQVARGLPNFCLPWRMSVVIYFSWIMSLRGLAHHSLPSESWFVLPEHGHSLPWRWRTVQRSHPLNSVGTVWEQSITCSSRGQEALHTLLFPNHTLYIYHFVLCFMLIPDSETTWVIFHV